MMVIHLLSALVKQDDSGFQPKLCRTNEFKNGPKTGKLPTRWCSNASSALRLGGCEFGPWPGQTKVYEILPIALLLCPQYSWLDIVGLDHFWGMFTQALSLLQSVNVCICEISTKGGPELVCYTLCGFFLLLLLLFLLLFRTISDVKHPNP